MIYDQDPFRRRPRKAADALKAPRRISHFGEEPFHLVQARTPRLAES